MSLSPTDFHLVNNWQRDFPLVSRPYAELGAWLGISEAEVIARLGKLAADGTVSRIGRSSTGLLAAWPISRSTSATRSRVGAVATNQRLKSCSRS